MHKDVGCNAEGSGMVYSVYGEKKGVEENEKLSINLKMCPKAVMGIEKMIIFVRRTDRNNW